MIVERRNTATRVSCLGAANGAQAGDRVFTSGFPLAADLGSEPKFTDGAISSALVSASAA